MAATPVLLSIVELGGYPDLTEDYRRAGFEVETVRSMRKALSRLKQLTPQAVVAEFNFQSDFRDRTSSLESLMATLQNRQDNVPVIVLFDQEYESQFEARVRSRWPIHEALPFPVDRERLQAALQRLTTPR